MVKALNITASEFGQVFSSLDDLAQTIKDKTGVRPSIRKLSAELLLDGAMKRKIELQQNHPDVKPTSVESGSIQNPEPDCQGESL